MPRQVALRVFLALALLLAQQTAIGHQYWHASAASLAGEAKKAPKADRLCEFHELLGTVLGIAGAAAPLVAFLSLSQPGFLAPVPAAREADALLHHSRDPPPIS